MDQLNHPSVIRPIKVIEIEISLANIHLEGPMIPPERVYDGIGGREDRLTIEEDIDPM